MLSCVVVKKNDHPSPVWRDDRVIKRRYTKHSAVGAVDCEGHEWPGCEQSSDISYHTEDFNPFRTVNQRDIITLYKTVIHSKRPAPNARETVGSSLSLP